MTKILLKSIQNKEIKPYSTKFWNFIKINIKTLINNKKLTAYFLLPQQELRDTFFISIISLILDIRKLEIPTMTATLKILIPKYNIITTYIIVGDS